MKDWLNLFLNRVSMYRLLSITLVALFCVALLLSLSGQLAFTPIAMLLSAAVLVAVAYGSNVIFGRLFGVQPHSESSFISALILFFLFTPSAQLTELLSLVLVAMMAMASKYILAYRGRHIFNPAAIAVAVIGLLGINYASWWVATPLLLPVSILCAFLILYKTRRLVLGGIFLGIAIPLIIGVALSNGQPLSSVLLSLPSWPLLFFVGFMLTEPLTLPPRGWQKYLVASIVAVLFAVPFEIGAFGTNPAIALVVGNAVAFLFGQRRHVALTFKDRHKIAANSEEYTFTTAQPIAFLPGQYMEITVPHARKDSRGLRRVFSIIGIPGEHTVRFGIKMSDPSSSFKTKLRAMQPGAMITATGIGGDFILPANIDTPLVFMAGGIGITPFVSHLLTLQQRNETIDATLIYAASSLDELAYVDVIKASGIKVIVVSDTNRPLPANDWVLHRSQRITKDDILKYVPDISKRTAYISGPPAMVDSAKANLRQLNVTHITCDYFTGY